MVTMKNKIVKITADLPRRKRSFNESCAMDSEGKKPLNNISLEIHIGTQGHELHVEL